MSFDPEATKALVDRFAARMQARMVENADKGGWENRTLNSFQTSFLRKHLELSEAIDRNDWATVASLSVDLANIAMMLSDRVGYDN